MVRRHGLLSLVACGLLLAGCQSGDDFQEYTKAEKGQDTHAHPEHGPHGGHVIELGKHEYHAEICLDPQTRKISIYMLGHDLDEPLAIAAESILLELEHGEDEVALELKPVAGEGEAGKASLFEVSGDAVPEEFDDIEKLHGHFHVDVDGKEYVGEVAHDHDGEEEDHDAESEEEEKGADKEGGE